MLGLYVPTPQGNVSLSLCLTHSCFSLPHYIFNYQVRREAHYLGEAMPTLAFSLGHENKVHLLRCESPNTIS